MERQIQDALTWLGVEWDEGPFLQSETAKGKLEAPKSNRPMRYLNSFLRSRPTIELFWAAPA